MFEAVRAKGLPVAYLTFEGEQHGFRKAENIKRALEAELYFYSKIFGFQPPIRSSRCTSRTSKCPHPVPLPFGMGEGNFLTKK